MESRNMRNTIQGVVEKAGTMNKTIVVKVTYRVKDPLYKKVVQKSRKFKAHDENNECGVGDVVQLMETRPLSKEKRFRVVKIVEKAE